MTIAYINAGTTLDSASGGSQTIAYPAGISSGNLLVVLGTRKDSSETITAPSSTLTWTERAARSTYHKIWTATYDGAATAPTSNTGGGGIFKMLAFSGISVGSPFLNSANAAYSQTNMRYPAMTVSVANSVVITFCKDNGPITSVAPSTNFTEVLDLNASASSMGVHIQYWIQTDATDIVATDLVVTGGGAVTQTGLVVGFVSDVGTVWPQYHNRINPLVGL